jgi:hypothetical protein
MATHKLTVMPLFKAPVRCRIADELHEQCGCYASARQYRESLQGICTQWSKYRTSPSVVQMARMLDASWVDSRP